jgi:glycosyltransferase involved in cell wall biosynthesis
VSAAPARVAILCPWVPPERSAVTQYVLQLAAGLSERAAVHVVWMGAGEDVPGAARTWRIEARGLRALPEVLATLTEIGADRVVLQYSPYLWSASGFDLAGPLLCLALRARGLAADVMWHELWIPVIPRPVALLRRLAQRIGAGVIGRASRRSIVTSRERLSELGEVAGRGARLAFVPMCSLVPVAPLAEGEREAVRRELGLAADELALILFGFDHDSRPTSGLVAMHRALADAGVRSRLVVIGTARVPEADAAMDRWILYLGFKPAREVSRLMTAGDVFLAPFVDGVSTRRTSVAAALAHGLPVVTTTGEHTDAAVFHDGVMALSRPGDDGAFAASVVELARSPARRRSLAEAGASLFERELSWPRHLSGVWEVHAT